MSEQRGGASEVFSHPGVVLFGLLSAGGTLLCAYFVTLLFHRSPGHGQIGEYDSMAGMFGLFIVGPFTVLFFLVAAVWASVIAGRAPKAAPPPLSR